MTRPIVSVIVPVWNVEAYLRECLDSVLRQTIGRDQLELIAVDDGSTDGSPAILDAYAAEYPEVTVLHETNSGGPGRPRNLGLDRATGTYVFFLDADDYLGDEALQRLVAMAERNDADVVLGRVVGLDGRRIPDVYERTRDRVDVEQVYRTLSAQKLFRRSLVTRLGLRFDEGIGGHEDGPFTLEAYLAARRISVVGDYSCYFIRPGGGVRPSVPRADLLERIERERIEVVARYRPPGVHRDVLLFRHLTEVARVFNRRWLADGPDERRRAFEAGARIVRRWHSRRMDSSLTPWSAIRIECLSRGLQAELEDIVAAPLDDVFGDPVIEGRRLFARYPHRGEPTHIPDRCFDITPYVSIFQRVTSAELHDHTLHLAGQAYLALVGGSSVVELRRWPRGPSIPITPSALPSPGLRDRQVAHPMAGFDAAVDLDTVLDGGPLSSGSWDVLITVGTPTVRRTAPLDAPVVVRDGRAAGDEPRLIRTARRSMRLQVGPQIAGLTDAGRTGSRRGPVGTRSPTRPGGVALGPPADAVPQADQRRRQQTGIGRPCPAERTGC